MQSTLDFGTKQPLRSLGLGLHILGWAQASQQKIWQMTNTDVDANLAKFIASRRPPFRF
jgi:hypothetical protein